MSLTKSTFRSAEGGNFETSTSAAPAPGQTNNETNNNPAAKRASSPMHLWHAEGILTKRSVMNRSSAADGFAELISTVDELGANARLKQISCWGKTNKLISGQ